MLRFNGIFVALACLAVPLGCKTTENVAVKEGVGAQKRRELRAGAWQQKEQDLALTAPEAEDGAPGALIDVTMTSQVGVLLDEVPVSMRGRAAAAYLQQPDQFWIERAKAQVRLATYRLVFRNYFYRPGKMQLPLPPESLWAIELVGPPARETGAKHDTVVVGYRLKTTLLTTPTSPKLSEPRLGTIGGTWEEAFTFPIDPELIFQRTGYACMDEAEFPPNSVDAEEADSFYDHECVVEKEPSLAGCHQHLPLPDKTCQQALRDHVGKVDTKLVFTRRAWSEAVANQVRVGPTTTTAGADLQVVKEEFHLNRTVYKYFAPGACELEEQCIAAPGWRRLLQFATSDRNTGNQTLDIGPIDYYLTGAGGPTVNDQNHVFEFSACHKHYHFTHYGSFALGEDKALTTKRGFCLQSTNRFSNIENSPLHHPYGGCEYQGVSVGWVDQYKIGLPCQWVDVTDVTTTKPLPLTFTSNPDGFLCEGVPVLDAAGHPVFEPTAFRTANGEVVSRAKCDFAPGWYDNNVDTYDVALQAPGEGYVTKPCDRGQVGPLRNCGLKNTKVKIACAAGAPTTLKCSVPAGAAPQVLRVCDHSKRLGTGIPCTHDAGLVSLALEAGKTNVSFTCPAARDAAEPGGAVALYTAPVLTGDAAATVTCAF